jgi:hypothetical protein
MNKKFKDIKYLTLDANSKRYDNFSRFFENSYRLIIPDINVVFVVNNPDNITINSNFDIEAVISKLYNLLKIGYRVVKLNIKKTNHIFYDYCIEYQIPEIDKSYYSLNGKMNSMDQRFNYQFYYVPSDKDWREIIGSFGYFDLEQNIFTSTRIHIDFPVLGFFKPDVIKVKPSLCNTCKYYCPSDLIDCAVNPSFNCLTVYDCNDYEFTKLPNHGQMYDELA